MEQLGIGWRKVSKVRKPLSDKELNDLKAEFKLLKESKPQLTYVNPNHPADHYSWSVATSWGAKSGVIAQKIH